MRRQDKGEKKAYRIWFVFFCSVFGVPYRRHKRKAARNSVIIFVLWLHQNLATIKPKPQRVFRGFYLNLDCQWNLLIDSFIFLPQLSGTLDNLYTWWRPPEITATDPKSNSAAISGVPVLKAHQLTDMSITTSTTTSDLEAYITMLEGVVIKAQWVRQIASTWIAPFLKDKMK